MIDGDKWVYCLGDNYLQALSELAIMDYGPEWQSPQHVDVTEEVLAAICADMREDKVEN